jgi:hypothetical protein
MKLLKNNIFYLYLDIVIIIQNMETFNIDTSKESIKDNILLAFTDIIIDYISKSHNINKVRLKKDIFNKFIELGIFDTKIHSVNTYDIKNKIMSVLITVKIKKMQK